MYRVYAYDEGEERKGPAELFETIQSARNFGKEQRNRGLSVRIYKQTTNRNGDVIETLVEN